MGPTVTADWEADSENRWTVSVWLGVTKMVRFGKMPVKFIVEIQYSVIMPEVYGTQWKFLFRFAPVIPSPFRLLRYTQFYRFLISAVTAEFDLC
jgi:hypothetical protein